MVNGQKLLTGNDRMLLVRQGSMVVQHIDSDFGEVIRPGKSNKGGTRKLMREWSFRTLPNREKVLHSWMTYSPSKESLYCFCCRLFCNKGNNESNFNSERGFNKWC